MLLVSVHSGIIVHEKEERNTIHQSPVLTRILEDPLQCVISRVFNAPPIIP